MRPINLKIKTKTQVYPIIIGTNLISNISKIIRKNSINFNKCLLIVDKNISKKIILSLKKSLNKKMSNIPSIFHLTWQLSEVKIKMVKKLMK